MDAPTPESSGSMIRTLAPLVMSSWASESSVASLPWAFTTEYCDGVSPAVARAWLRYGASNSVYRAEETVSGRMTPTLPLPRAARGFRSAIASKVRSSWPIEICGTAPVELVELAVELADGLDELLQAAAARHRASDTDTTSPFLAT